MASQQPLQTDFFTDGIFKKALNFIQAREDPVDFLDLFMQYDGDKETFGGEQHIDARSQRKFQKVHLTPLEENITDQKKQSDKKLGNISLERGQSLSKVTREKQLIGQRDNVNANNIYGLENKAQTRVHKKIKHNDQQQKQSQKELFLEQHSFSKQRINQISFYQERMISPRTQLQPEKQIFHFRSINNINDNPYSLNNANQMLQNHFNLTIQPCSDPSKKWVVKKIIKPKAGSNNGNILNNTILLENTDCQYPLETSSKGDDDSNNLARSQALENEQTMFKQLGKRQLFDGRIGSPGSLMDLKAILSSLPTQQPIVSAKTNQLPSSSRDLRQFNTNQLAKNNSSSQIKQGKLNSVEQKQHLSTSNKLIPNKEGAYFTSTNRFKGSKSTKSQLESKSSSSSLRFRPNTQQTQQFSSSILQSPTSSTLPMSKTLPRFKFPKKISSQTVSKNGVAFDSFPKFLDPSQNTLPIFSLNFNKTFETRLLLDNLLG